MKPSYRLKSGQRPTSDGQPGGTYAGIFVEAFEYLIGSGDLDECGGRYGVTSKFPEGSYYYVLTEDFPFVPMMFRGTPTPDFGPRQGHGGRPSPRGRSR